MTKYYCDRCKEETPIASLNNVQVSQDVDLSVASAKVKKYELCSQCRDMLDLFLKNHE